jgi:hypothetical protein
MIGVTAAPAVIQPTTNFSNGAITYTPVGDYRYRPELSTNQVVVFALPVADYQRFLRILMYTRFRDGRLQSPALATLNVRERCQLGSWRRCVRTALIHQRYQPALQIA